MKINRNQIKASKNFKTFPQAIKDAEEFWKKYMANSDELKKMEEEISQKIKKRGINHHKKIKRATCDDGVESKQL